MEATAGPVASGEVAELEDQSVASGQLVLVRLLKRALGRLLGVAGADLRALQAQQLFTPEEQTELADALAAAIGTADLLGRAKIRRHWRQVLQRHGIAEGLLPGSVPDEEQDTDYSCGAVALQSVLGYFGIQVAEPQLMRELGTDPQAGTSVEAMLRVAAAHGLVADARAHLTIADLCRVLDAGVPVICPIQAWPAPDQDPEKDQAGHYVVVIGHDAGHIYLEDPATLEPGPIRVDRAVFDRNWHDQDADGQRYDHYGIACWHPDGPAVPAPQALLEVAPMPPRKALDYFRGLIPTLGADPERYGEDWRRRAFTVAVATEINLVQKIQDLIRQRLETGQGISSAPREIQQLLDDTGVSSTNPQYAEAIFRTNVRDAYNQGATEELQDPDVVEVFPVWQYSNPNDGRSRLDHAARDGNYYPSSVPFTQVRGSDAKDAINCRCDQIPIDKWTWAKLKRQGKRIADGYPDVPVEIASPRRSGDPF